MSSASSTPLPPADFGSRFSAFMIDAALLFAVQWIVVVVLSRQLQAVGMTSQQECAFDAGRVCEGPNTGLAVLLTLIVIASTLAYHAVFEGKFGATPGKHWMGLQVQGTDAMMPIGIARATARSLVRQAYWVVLFLFLDASPLGVAVPAALFLLVPLLALGLVAAAAFTSDHRGVHDHVANTNVVRVKPLSDESRDPSFEGPLWTDPNQPEELPEHLDDHDDLAEHGDDRDDHDDLAEDADLAEHADLDREESL